MDTNYEYEWDSKYCYPNCYILKNKLNIKDQEVLQDAERSISSIKLLDIKMNPMKGDLDLRHLLAIHKFIFGDIYTWAGKIRSVNISKGNEFCRFMFINEQLETLFDKLKKENYLLGFSREVVVLRLSYYLGELNAIHPFREGNGRTQRAFIEILAQVAGYYLDFSEVSADEMIRASADSFNQDYNKMNALIDIITTNLVPEEQREFILKITSKNSPIRTTWQEVIK